VIGIAILVVAFVIGIPVFLMSMGVVAGILGTFLKDDAEARYAGSELVDLNQ
jgi:hypothetical protein